MGRRFSTEQSGEPATRLRRRPSHSPSAAPPKSSGEDEQLLWDLADEMDPEDGCRMEYLRDLLAEHKRNRPPRGTERMVSPRIS